MKILSTNHYYYVKMTSNGGIKKFIRVDMEKPYQSINEVFDTMDNYVKDGICWKLDERKIYMCNCNDLDNFADRSVRTKYSRYTVWFIKIRDMENNIFYMSTYNVKIFPIKSFKEVFNNITLPSGCVIDDYDHLYISNVSE